MFLLKTFSAWTKTKTWKDLQCFFERTFISSKNDLYLTLFFPLQELDCRVQDPLEIILVFESKKLNRNDNNIDVISATKEPVVYFDETDVKVWITKLIIDHSF